MKTHYRLILLLSGAFLLGVAAGNSVTLQQSLAQGYTGLIAGGGKNGSKDQPTGYKGLIPGYVAPQKNTTTGQQQQPGRTNALPGQTAAPQGARPPGPSSRQNMSLEPGYKEKPVRTIDDIKLQSARKKEVSWQDADKASPQIDALLSKALTPLDKSILSTPRFRVHGMLPREYSTQMKIDKLMAFVNDPSLSDKERKINANKAREKLVDYAQYLELKSQFPETLYKKMGLPATYVSETREGVKKSLDRVDAALKDLRKYQ